MASFLLQEWATALNNVLQGLRLMPHRTRWERAADLQDVADLLLHIVRQMKRARLEFLARALTTRQFQALWRHKQEEVKRLLCTTALRQRLQRSILAERVLQLLADWEHYVDSTALRPLQGAELRGVEHRLEDLADALAIYACAENEQWSDTQPSL